MGFSWDCSASRTRTRGGDEATLDVSAIAEFGIGASINRYYDPSSDQFLSIDPAVAQTGEPYAFSGDDPLNATDPLGLMAPSKSDYQYLIDVRNHKKFCQRHPGIRGHSCGGLWHAVAGTFNNVKHDYQKLVSASRSAADSQPGPLGAVNRWGNSHPQQAVATVGVAVACGTGVACVPAIAAAGVAQVGEDVANHCSATQTAIDGGLSAGGAAVGFVGELGIGALEGSNGIQSAVRAHNAAESAGATAAGAC